MQPMQRRLSDRGAAHCITHLSWEVRPFWQRLRALLPVRHGTIAIDDTGFPKQRTASIGVNRQHCGAVGKVANFARSRSRPPCRPKAWA
jgi:SRSO17 transposase